VRCPGPGPRRGPAPAAQLALALQQPGQVAITARGERTRRASVLSPVGRWFAAARPPAVLPQPVARPLHAAPIIMAAIDLAPGLEDLSDALGLAVLRILRTHPDARLTC